ncbi:PTS sugar transporter subunit IIA [Fangia hongkongensis]|uniref:PTS sugar transporter subunit IIA n=1 Tax=Fangia hongkongensis TaxID=270495 RepID=UPI00036F5E59|nr:PTS sugar transporter subunit IIA [Fangia hongkongensis]
MNFLSPFISQERTLNKASLSSQKRVFEVLSNLLQNPDDGVSGDLIYQKLFERERIGSTVIGRGVAVPHCRVEKLEVTRLAILTLESPLEYDTNQQAVEVFIAAIFPLEVNDVHIQFMAELVKFLKRPNMLEHIRKADSNEALYALFSQ